MIKSYFSYFLIKTYVVGTQKNRFMRRFFLAPKTNVKNFRLENNHNFTLTFFYLDR